ncbi:unnamed protein product [Sphagnum balticum]
MNCVEELRNKRPVPMELGSVTDGRPGPARQKRALEQKRDSNFDEPGPARHDTATEVGVQADRARPGKNEIRMNLLIQDPRS